MDELKKLDPSIDTVSSKDKFGFNHYSVVINGENWKRHGVRANDHYWELHDPEHISDSSYNFNLTGDNTAENARELAEAFIKFTKEDNHMAKEVVLDKEGDEYLVCDAYEGDALVGYPTKEECIAYCEKFGNKIIEDKTNKNFSQRIKMALFSVRSDFRPLDKIKKLLNYFAGISEYDFNLVDSNKDMASYELEPNKVDNENANTAYITVTNEDGGFLSYNIVDSNGDSKPVVSMKVKVLKNVIQQFEKDFGINK